MATKKKLLQAAAGTAAAGGGAGGLDVSEVFSTYVFTGNNSTQTITNGIDLSGEGGLVWTKNRGAAEHPNLYDTERGVHKILRTTLTSAESTNTNSLTAFNSDGFTLSTGDNANYGTNDAVSWTWRKAPRFFDCVTYTGTGSAQNISHNLGTTVGTIFVKCTTDTFPWTVFHNSLGATEVIILNSTAASYTDSAPWNNTAPTDSVFTVGTDSGTNSSGQTYVAYLFAHNDGDGEFGPDGDQDIIKCGSYTGNATDGNKITLGWEPQWILFKNASVTENWRMFDVMRGISTPYPDPYLDANLSNAETSFATTNYVNVEADGFSVGTNPSVNGNGNTIIYIAIRRGPMAVPEDATDVFAMDTLGGTLPNPPAFNSGFTVDAGLYKVINSSSSWLLSSRLTQGRRLSTDSTAAEAAESAQTFDFMDGYYNATSVSTNYQSWMWKRAPNFFDVVTYTGTGSSSARAVPHNLGVVPEMMWVKRRDTNSGEGWAVYHKGLNGGTDPEDYYVTLNTSSAEANNFYRWADTAPTATDFYVTDNLDWSGGKLIAYLFASLDGVSKVGSYTGNGSSQTIDCGFSSGARFVLIKGYDSASNNWWVFDSERGIVAGNDGYLPLNETNAEVTSYDPIDPDSSGFIVNQVSGGSNTNYSGRNYIFYAIA